MNALQELVYQIATDEGVRAQLRKESTLTGLGEGLSEEEQNAFLSLCQVLTFSSERLLKRLDGGLPDGLWDVFAENLVSNQVA